MGLWETVKKDLQKGLKEGVAYVKEGAIVAKQKAEVLGEEAKRQYKTLNLKSNAHKGISELGGKVYSLSSKAGNPLRNKDVMDIVARIKSLEAQIAKLEGKGKAKKR